jgi:hypothetical protein
MATEETTEHKFDHRDPLGFIESLTHVLVCQKCPDNPLMPLTQLEDFLLKVYWVVRSINTNGEPDKNEIFDKEFRRRMQGCDTMPIRESLDERIRAESSEATNGN